MAVPPQIGDPQDAARSKARLGVDERPKASNALGLPTELLAVPLLREPPEFFWHGLKDSGGQLGALKFQL